MRNTNAPLTADQLHLETHPEFNVVPAYDGGIRAKEFFDTLVLDHSDSGALVALLGGRPSHAGSATTVGVTLRQLAESVNVQVFCKEIDWPAMDSHFAVQITQPQLRELRRHAPQPTPCAGQPRWGLNE